MLYFSTRAQGESAPPSGSKLVQLQRQSSSTNTGLSTLLNSSSSSLHFNGPSLSGGALDFGGRAGAGAGVAAAAAGATGGVAAAAVAAAGPGDLGLPGTGAGAGTGAGGAGPSSGAVSSSKGLSGLSSSSLTFQSGLINSSGSVSEIHPLHFNWVFWFMHRVPGSKITNYESAMKKIATFGSVEDFWAVYSHLIRPHELPNVSDYHLFKQGVRPVWEDATNINGGKWIVRLKKGLASRYWENLVMAVIGDQFDVGSEICGIVLSIRGAEDILSIWNQSAHEGRINLKIRDTLKRVLNLPADTIMEYKTHNDAMKDNSSFRNTDVFR
ncbi:Eukaryotic translation initiation factor 4E type 2 [Lunasporangiospora selenospora]|uniref:Eukaryotic translation initiation factor 4E type 2 n=1 Tax=Lunasporangiospora selenospora TaxID=979761 RepID=A0A9P6G0L0_9FUNG|nr:Eukaryotic translation initiation factor 4E type 2 [Lunasporangiospora selenospora]